MEFIKEKFPNFINSNIMKQIFFGWYKIWLAFQNQDNIISSKLFPEVVTGDKDFQSN